MALMAGRDFPFALPGVVHLRNVVVWAGPLRTGSALEVEVYAEALAAHPKGTTVDLVTQVRADDEPVWWGRSTYLSRGRAAVDAGSGEAAPAPAPVEVDERPRALWRVPADTGRRYARVSGDINPIHQNALAAKAFGFPAAIAHGMWLQARLLSSYGPTLPLAGGCDVAFRSPVLLPSSLRLHDRAVAPGAWDVELRSGAGRVHLSGSIRPA
jgi:acyl dehydratase